MERKEKSYTKERKKQTKQNIIRYQSNSNTLGIKVEQIKTIRIDF